MRIVSDGDGHLPRWLRQGWQVGTSAGRGRQLARNDGCLTDPQVATEAVGVPRLQVWDAQTCAGDWKLRERLDGAPAGNDVSGATA